MLTDQDLARLALFNIRGTGAAAVRRSFQSELAALPPVECLQELVPKCDAKVAATAVQKALEVVERSASADIDIIPLSSAKYPSELRKIADPPPFLFVLGVLPNTWAKAVAVIGTRKPAPGALAVTEDIVRALADDPESVVVSGLAYGIDVAAHTASLRNRIRTIAVLANGLDTVYPRPHKGLAREIVDAGGCLLSELPIGEQVSRFALVARDRLQSGLSLATILVQSSVDGGSMHTARFALQQQRKLIALAPLGGGPDWSGNRFLLSKEPLYGEPVARKFEKFSAPYALKLSQNSSTEFIRAALRSGFVSRFEASQSESMDLPILNQGQSVPTLLKRAAEEISVADDRRQSRNEATAEIVSASRDVASCINLIRLNDGLVPASESRGADIAFLLGPVNSAIKNAAKQHSIHVVDASRVVVTRDVRKAFPGIKKLTYARMLKELHLGTGLQLALSNENAPKDDAPSISEEILATAYRELLMILKRNISELAYGGIDAAAIAASLPNQDVRTLGASTPTGA